MKKSVNKQQSTASYRVYTRISEGTTNAIEIMLEHVVFNRHSLVARIVFAGQEHPDIFLSKLIMSSQVCALTARAMSSHAAVVDMAVIQGVAGEAVTNFQHHAMKSIIGPDGKRRVRLNPDGSIPSNGVFEEVAPGSAPIEAEIQEEAKETTPAELNGTGTPGRVSSQPDQEDEGNRGPRLITEA